MSRVKSEYFDVCERMGYFKQPDEYCQLEEQEIIENMLSKIDELDDVLSALRSNLEYQIDEMVLEGVGHA